jgi:hypothetical protein
VKLQGGYVAKKEGLPKHEEEWGKWFMAGTTTVDALSSINYKNDWVVDSSVGIISQATNPNFQAFEIIKEMM